MGRDHERHTGCATRQTRALGELERALLGRLVSVEFPGRDELAVQLKDAAISWHISQGAPALIIAVPESSPRARVKRRIPMEAEGKDEDGKALHFLLHVVDGRMKELEIFRKTESEFSDSPVPRTCALCSIRDKPHKRSRSETLRRLLEFRGGPD